MKKETIDSCYEFAKQLKAAGVCWRDATLYVDCNAEKMPSIFKNDVGTCEIKIEIGHYCFPHIWTMTCKQLGFDMHFIHCTTAKRQRSWLYFTAKNGLHVFIVILAK